jgi:hypothetical protein
MIRPQPPFMFMLCGCCALAGAAALSGPTPPTQPPAANAASVGRRALQGAGYGGGASSEPTGCAAIAEQVLALPACAAVQAQLFEAPAPGSQPGCAAGTTATEIDCPVACAELWLPATERCSQSSDPRAVVALEAAAPGVVAACETAAGVLATAAATVTVSGLACHGLGNAVYLLQPVPLNGRAHYATADGGWHLYWTPHSGNAGSAEWFLDTDTDDSYPSSHLLSAADAAPTGSAIWSELCNGQWTNTRLQLTPSQADDGWCATALQRLAPQLAATCCRAEDGPLCGESGGVPGACDADCGGLWAPYASQCRGEAAFYGQPELSSFFVGEVRAFALVVFSAAVGLC